jgi:hypothetical protein
MEKASPSLYVRRAKLVSILGWWVAGAVTVGGLVFVTMDFVEWNESVTTQSSLEARSSELATVVFERGELVEDLTRVASEAKAAERLQSTLLDEASLILAIDFDRQVEAMAKRGEIGRNAFSGLGFPPPSLLAEFSTKQSDARAAFVEAADAARSAEESVGTAQDEENTTRAELEVTRTLLALTEAQSQVHLDQALWRLSTTGALALILAAIAAAFWIGAAKAQSRDS